MSGIYEQVGKQSMDTQAIVNPDLLSGSITWRNVEACLLSYLLPLRHENNVRSRATFKNLIIAGEFHGY